MFTFSVFHRNYPVWANLVQNLSWNSISKLIRICRIQQWCSLFPFWRELHFFGNHLVQKIRIVSLSWNLVLKLIQVCRIQWWCFSSVLNWKYLFWVNLIQKIKICSLSWNLVPRLIRIYKIQKWSLLFLFSIGNNLFGTNFSKKSKSSVLTEIWQLD